jgi:hypothetical protein
MRKQSLKCPICICCNTNRCDDRRNTFCKECKVFIYNKLALSNKLVSMRLAHTDYSMRNQQRGKCSFCEAKCVVVHKHIETKKIYNICQYHLDKWLQIGCELGELSNILN